MQADRFPYLNPGGAGRGFLTACVLTALLWGMHCVWLSRDTRPPVWDMALHQTYALNYLEGYSTEAAEPWQKSGNYPPFVHLVIAAMFWIFHPGPHIAVLANIPATFILLWATYDLARDLAGDLAARWACIFFVLTPYAVWISRETILDYWLAAFFAASLAVLRRTRGFEARGWSLLLGAILGLGLLTKWFLAGLFLFPLVSVFVRFRVWNDAARCIRLIDALLVAAIVAAPWYLPNIPGLVGYFGENAAIGAREGEPPVFSFQSLIYYLRLLEGYQLFALLFVLLALACFYCLRKGLIRDWQFLAAAIAGGWLVMTLLRTKDPRFTLPLLAPLTVIPGAWFQAWAPTRANAALKGIIVGLLCLQIYAANFGVSWIPQRAVLLPGYQGSLRWDWNLYLLDYFDVLGKPKREDWKHREIIERLTADAKERSLQPSLAIIPDLPWFNESNFRLYARMRKMSFPVQHVQSRDDPFRGFHYVLMVEGDQGMSWTTGNSLALNQIVVDHPAVFRLVELYLLPKGGSARLYFIDRKES